MALTSDRLPSSADPLTWHPHCDTIDGVREIPLRCLAPGQEFELVLSATSGRRIRGKLLRHGFASIDVEYDGGKGGTSFVTAEGESITFGGGRTRTSWSPDTPVLLFKGETHMTAEAAGLPGITKTAKAKVAAKPVAKAKAKVAKAPKTLNPCLCGCGEKVTGRFRMGHDSRYYSLIKKVLRGELGFEKLPALMRNSLVNVAGCKKAAAAHG
jgi:hypothetical protein